LASWTILTGEYPPGCGGVGDYTAQVAAALAAAGDQVVVCVPRRADGVGHDHHAGVELVELPDRFGPSTRRELTRRLGSEPVRFLVQYVPNAFGAKGANLSWCRWLARRCREHRDDLRVMFHEPYFYFEWTRPDRGLLAIVQRMMAATLLRAASQVYVSTASWGRYLRPYAPAGAPSPLVLPIPSSVSGCDRPGDAADARARLLRAEATTLVGHFGTYGGHIASMLKPAIAALLEAERRVAVVCIGRGSESFVGEIARRQPVLRDRLTATGRVSASDAAVWIAACELLIQPFPDGVTTRRTSLMAGLINGTPVLTTAGALTEPVWSDTQAVALVPASDQQELINAARRLAADAPSRTALGARGQAVYFERFALGHSVALLRGERGAGGRAPDEDASASEGGAAA
jgi:glycosyltransferase involved in cell wall biosynthesis